jgi:hypothetical protein
MKTSLALLFTILIAHPAVSQTPGYAGGYGIELGVGGWFSGETSASVTTSGTTISSSTGGFRASLGFHYWSSENLAVGLTLSLINAGADITTALATPRQETNTVSAAMIDFRFSWPVQQGRSIIPYGHVSLGPVFGFITENSLARQAASTQTALGGRIGCGVDLALSQLALIGVRGSYLIMGNFSHPVAGRSNFNGFELQCVFAIVWGGSPVH